MKLEDAYFALGATHMKIKIAERFAKVEEKDLAARILEIETIKTKDIKDFAEMAKAMTIA